MRDFLSEFLLKRVISPQAGAADNVAQAGAIIDGAGFESVTYGIQTGTIADAGAEFTVLLEEGDESDLSDAAAVADADMISQGSGAPETDASFIQSDDDEVRKLGYRGTKRYTRLTITPANNAGTWGISAFALLAHARQKPTTQSAS